jgi:hypothetical protein
MKRRGKFRRKWGASSGKREFQNIPESGACPALNSGAGPERRIPMGSTNREAEEPQEGKGCQMTRKASSGQASAQ